MKKFKLQFGQFQFDCVYVTKDVELRAVYEALEKSRAKVFGLDLETGKVGKFKEDKDAGLDPHKSFIRLCQIYDPENKTVYVVDCRKCRGLEALAPIFKHKKFIAHYAIFEAKHLLHAGVHFRSDQLHCSQIMAQFVYNAEHSPFEPEEEDEDEDKPDSKYFKRGGFSLDNLVGQYFDLRISKAEQVSNWNAKSLTKSQVVYAALDAVLTYELGKVLMPKIVSYKMKKAYELYQEMIHAVAAMEYKGMLLDKREHSHLIMQWEEKKALAELKCKKYFGETNLRSSKQLDAWVKEYYADKPKLLNRWPKSEKTQNYSFNKTHLADLPTLPPIESLLAYRKYATLLSTFGESLQSKVSLATGRLHGSFVLGETRTGRLSSRNPNLQNMPARDDSFRHIFTAPQDSALVVADFSQIEIRVGAELSKDPVMLEAFATGVDLHKKIVSVLSGKMIDDVTKEERQLGKACFSGDTEVLTREGWKRFDSILAGDIAVWDSSNGQIHFEHLPIRSGGEQELFSIIDRNVDLLLTSNHRIAYTTAAGDVRTFTLEDRGIPHVRHWISAGRYRNTPVVTSAFARLVAMVAADGSFEGGSIRLGFIKRRKIERCVSLLEKAGVQYSSVTYRNGVTRVTIKDKPLIEKILGYCSIGKDLSWATINDFPLDDFLDEVSYWDAHRLKSKQRTRVLFSTSRQQTADIVQAMCALSGRQSTLRGAGDGLLVSYREQIKPLSRANLSFRQVKQRKEVFCCQTSTGYLLVRRDGKVSIQGNCNFGLMFGMGATKLAKYARASYGVLMSEEEAQRAWEAYHSLYSVYSSWCNRQRALAEKVGFARTPLGKMRRLLPNEVYTKAVNTPVQGGAAEVAFKALSFLHKRLAGRAFITCTVHDEIVVECTKERASIVEALVVKAMEDALLYIFPDATTSGLVEAHIGQDWATAKNPVVVGQTVEDNAPSFEADHF